MNSETELILRRQNLSPFGYDFKRISPFLVFLGPVWRMSGDCVLENGLEMYVWGEDF